MQVEGVAIPVDLAVLTIVVLAITPRRGREPAALEKERLDGSKISRACADAAVRTGMQ